MSCRICKWLCDRFCPPGVNSGTYWKSTFEWEETYSQNWEPWDEDEILRKRANEAARLVDIDPNLALQKFSDLADDGSAYAMRWAGTLCMGKKGVDEDLELAEDYFRRGLCAGSWMATISYASLLYRRGAHDAWLRHWATVSTRDISRPFFGMLGTPIGADLAIALLLKHAL